LVAISAFKFYELGEYRCNSIRKQADIANHLLKVFTDHLGEHTREYLRTDLIRESWSLVNVAAAKDVPSKHSGLMSPSVYGENNSFKHVFVR